MKVCLIFLKVKNTHDVISNILLNINYKYVHVFCNKSFLLDKFIYMVQMSQTVLSFKTMKYVLYVSL